MANSFMIETERRFRANGEILVGRSIKPRLDRNKGYLFLHGAGQSTSNRARPLARILAEQCDLASFAFDFSGHGDSTGTLSDSSLAKRLAEALSACSVSELEEPLGVCAFSMGGHVALQLLRHVRVKALCLFYPAVYTRGVQDIRFGDATFTTLIRKQGSWADSDALDSLRNYEGHLLIVTGEKDEVIPKDVIDLIRTRADRTISKKHIEVKGASHNLIADLMAQSDTLDEVVSAMASLMA